MNHEIRDGQGNLLETLEWTGPAWRSDSEELERAREALRQRAIARAYELGALAYERRNPSWLESDHYDFPCREISENEVEVTTPVGTFTLKAHRARKGESTTAVIVFNGGIGIGGHATEDQESLPVTISGRLNPPWWKGGDWHFQPSCFTYADGTSSSYLGSYPIAIVLKARKQQGTP
jgi:hypothetical protein